MGAIGHVVGTGGELYIAGILSTATTPLSGPIRAQSLESAGVHMTVYTFDMGDFYIDEDGVSAFTDDNGETVIIADELVEVAGPRVFTVHFV